jgi:hypothetical protein
MKDSTIYLAEQVVTAWAVPNRYKMEGEGEYIIKVMLGDHKPYNDGAFKVSSRDLSWEVAIPENAIECQIASIEETLNDEHRSHAVRVLDLTQAIQDLRALPAPAQEDYDAGKVAPQQDYGSDYDAI